MAKHNAQMQFSISIQEVHTFSKLIISGVNGNIGLVRLMIGGGKDEIQIKREMIEGCKVQINVVGSLLTQTADLVENEDQLKAHMVIFEAARITSHTLDDIETSNVRNN